MGLAASVACLAAVAAAAAEPPGAGAARGGATGADAGGAAAVKGCSLEDNTTQAFLNCLLWRREHGDAGFGAETHQPTAEADDKAMEHLRQLNEQKRRPDNLENVLTQSFKGQAMDWASTGTGMPRIYILPGGAWDRTCDMMEATLGYRYSLEHWMQHVIKSNVACLTDDVDVADFVYLPHCATGIFMHIVARDIIREQKKGPSAAAARRPRRRGPANRTGEWLIYEGNLPRKAVADVNNQYLQLVSERNWAQQADFRRCFERPTCRFLIVSIYGRHVWRRLSKFLGDRAVWITHSGLSGWLGEQEPELFLGGLGRGFPGEAPAAEGGSNCRAACADHCIMEPPAVFQEDVVMPWIVAFQWTPRSRSFNSRDILAFYSGTDNSCSRVKLAQLFSPSFHAEISGRAVPHGDVPRKARTVQRILAFPADFRLRQEEWSELAFRSRLCLVPDGDSPNTGRLIEVIMHGCVPMIISDRLQPPFHEIIDWPSIAFFVREASIPDLPDILRSLATPLGMRMVQAKQKLLEEAAHVLDYDRDTVSSVMLIALRERIRRWQARVAGGGG